MDVGEASLNERAFLFGSHNHLIGIMTDPGTLRSRTNAVAILILNAGFVHRIGPERIYTRMARNLAQAGFPVLRFDFSGIGDSEVRKEQLPYEESTIRDAQDAMDLMSTNHGVSRFLLVGICSGADNAIRIALSDHRVVGAVGIEGHAFSTPGYVVGTYLRRLFRWRMWWRLVSGQLRPLRWLKSLGGVSKSVGGVRTSQNAQRQAELNQLTANLHTLVERGVRLCLIYSTLGPSYHNFRSGPHREVEAWRDPRKICVALFDKTDHTFTPLSQQELLIGTVCAWAQEHFADGSGLLTAEEEGRLPLIPPSGSDLKHSPEDG